MSQKPDVQSILKLRVPVLVRLANHHMKVEDVLALGPGAILELPKHADDALDLMVNNKVIGRGTAVKVGENYGLKVQSIHKPEDRIRALGPQSPTR